MANPHQVERAFAHRESKLAELSAEESPTLRLISPALTLLGISLGAYLLFEPGASWQHALIVPGGFLFGFFVENALHRFALHHARGGFLYANHISHHRGFVPGAMPIRNYRELFGILFPAWATLAVVVLTSPLGVLLAFAWDLNAALLWAASGAAYVTVYELLHLSTHLPDAEQGWLGWWARHHLRHHELERMAHENFSVSFPLVDRWVGTTASCHPADQANSSPAPVDTPIRS